MFENYRQYIPEKEQSGIWAFRTVQSRYSHRVSASTGLLVERIRWCGNGEAVPVLRDFAVGLLCVSALAGLFASTGFAQNTQERQTVQDTCLKAMPGKGEELQTFIRNVEVPLHQALVDSGNVAAWLELRAVIPRGDSAPCDYRFAAVDKHGFAEPPSPEQMEAAIKRAGLKISVQDYFMQREALAHVVAVEIWAGIGSAGTPQQKGDFLSLNHYKVKPGANGEWLRLENTYWKPLVEEWTKAGNKGSYATYLLWMPQGESQPYNAMSLDDFPDWKSMTPGGSSLMTMWPKLYPGTDSTAVFDQHDRIRSVYNKEIYQISELLRPTAPVTK
jgi:hypothetical protein